MNGTMAASMRTLVSSAGVGEVGESYMNRSAGLYVAHSTGTASSSPRAAVSDARARGTAKVAIDGYDTHEGGPHDTHIRRAQTTVVGTRSVSRLNFVLGIKYAYAYAYRTRTRIVRVRRTRTGIKYAYKFSYAYAIKFCKPD